MKNRAFPFILCLTLITVFTTAISCGCVFAEAKELKPIEITKPSHCELHEKGSAATKESKSDVCCTGCQLQNARLNSKTALPQLQAEHLTIPAKTATFIEKNALPFFTFPTQGLCPRNQTRSLSVSGAEDPLHIVFESLLI